VRVSFPPDGALVRADVPVFGVATCPQFKEWRLEVAKKFGPEGEALEPEWRLLARGTQAIRFDPWSAGQVKWDPNRGAPGNLFTWARGRPVTRICRIRGPKSGACIGEADTTWRTLPRAASS